MFEAKKLAIAYYQKHYGKDARRPIHVAVSVKHQDVIELDAPVVHPDAAYCFTLIMDNEEIVARLIG